MILKRNAVRTAQRSEAFKKFTKYLKHNVELQRAARPGTVCFPFVPVPWGSHRYATVDIALFTAIIEEALDRAGVARGSEEWRSRAFASAVLATHGFTARWVAMTAAPPLLPASGNDARYDAFERRLIKRMYCTRDAGLQYAGRRPLACLQRSIVDVTSRVAKRKVKETVAELRGHMLGVAKALGVEGKAVRKRMAEETSSVGLPAMGYKMELALAMAESLGVFPSSPPEPGELLMFSDRVDSGLLRALSALTKTSAPLLSGSRALASLGVRIIQTALTDSLSGRSKPRPDAQGLIALLCEWGKVGMPAALPANIPATATGAEPAYLPGGVAIREPTTRKILREMAGRCLDEVGRKRRRIAKT